MAIEIIRPGTKKNATCAECGAVLRYSDEDIQNNITNTGCIGMCGNSVIERFIICPQCNEKIVLEATR